MYMNVIMMFNILIGIQNIYDYTDNKLITIMAM